MNSVFSAGYHALILGGYQEIDIRIVRNEVAPMNVFCHAHPLAAIRPILKKRGILKAVDLWRMQTDDIVRLTGLLIICHTPPTKSGKRVMFLTLEDETGLLDVVAFENVQKQFARTGLTSQVLTIQGKLQRRGVHGKAISVIKQTAVFNLCGPLENFCYCMKQTTKHESGKT